MDALTALALLTPIPAEDFVTDKFSDYEGKCCVIGHLQRLDSKDPTDYSPHNCWDIEGTPHPLRDSSSRYLAKHHHVTQSIVSVNNSDTINGYNEPEIKDRVIHLLTDMVNAGY